MNTRPIDSIAQHVVPDAHFSSIYWWMAMAIVLLWGIIYFVLKHFAKINILDGRPRPKLMLMNGKRCKTTITFPKMDDIDIMNEVEKRVSDNIALLKKKYSVQEADPYLNPSLIFRQNYNAVNNYNNDVESYLEDMEVYYKRTIYDQLMSTYYKPVSIAVYAKGRKMCKNLQIQMTMEVDRVYLFDGRSRTQKEGKCDIAPDKNQVDRSSDLYGLLPNDQEPYAYYEWDLIPFNAKANYQCESLTSGVPDQNIIPTIFVDTRYHQNVILRWRINGEDIPEAGRTGKICIKVE